MDDLGFTDNPYYSSLSNDFRNNNNVSFQMKTLEYLFKNSIRLNYHYSEPTCSPTRSSLLTGMYPWKTGVAMPIPSQTAGHLDKNITLLPQYLSNSNAKYNTLISGKWHLGSSSTDLLPNSRGFNNENNMYFTDGETDFFGKYTCKGFGSYDRSAINNNDVLEQDIIQQRNELFNDEWCVYNFFNHDGIFYNENNTYTETLFLQQILKFLNDTDAYDPYFIFYSIQTPHFPLTTPPIFDLNNNSIDYSACNHIMDDDYNNRKTFCKMMIYIDLLLDELLKAVDLNETVIIFSSDNGPQPTIGGPGVTYNLTAGQTLPLRGAKTTVFEGGIRSGAFIHGGYNYFDSNLFDCDYNNLFHVSDWIPTLFDMIGVNEYVDTVNNLDGISLWSDIKNNCLHLHNEDNINTTKRDEIISIKLCDNGSFGSTYIRKDKWKLVINGTNQYCTSAYDGNGYYLFYDGKYSSIPNEIWYENFVSNNDSLFRSKCYDDMNDTERNNENNFLFDDVMLFDISNDNIEACNVANFYPEIVEELLSYLDQQIELNEYNGGERFLPETGAVLAQLNNESFICDPSVVFIRQWKDFPDLYVNTSWNTVWEKAVKLKERCEHM